MRSSVWIAACVLLPQVALANPVGVKKRIEHGDKVMVSCAPGFCTQADEERLIATATRLQQQTGGRVIVIRTPPLHQAEAYAALSDGAALGPKDLLLARDDKGWAARAPGLAPAMLPQLVELAAQATSLEAGLAAVARQFPKALVDQPAPKAAPPAAAVAQPAAAPKDAAQQEPPAVPAAAERASADADAAASAGDGLLYAQIAGLVAVAAAALFLLLRRR